MWGDQAASPIHLLHTFHSVGMLVAAPMAGPFLSRTNQSDNTTATTTSMIQEHYAIHSSGYHNASQTFGPSRIYIPFGIIGGVGALGCCCFLAFHVLGWTFINLAPLGTTATAQHTDSHSVKDASDNQASVNEPRHGSDASDTIRRDNPKPVFKWTFIVVLFLAYALIMYRDIAFATYLPAIGVKSALHMTKQQATYLATSYCGAYAGGRVASIICSKYINIHILLYTELVTALVFCALLAWLGLDGQVQLWVLVCVLSVFSAPTYPTIMAWVNHYMPVTGLVMASIDIGIGAGSFSALWVGGYIFDHYGAAYIFYLSVTSAAVLVLSVTSLQMAALHWTRPSVTSTTAGNTSADHEHCNSDSEVDETSPLIN